MKIPLLPNNVGKKSANDMGPQQGHNKRGTLGKVAGGYHKLSNRFRILNNRLTMEMLNESVLFEQLPHLEITQLELFKLLYWNVK